MKGKPTGYEQGWRDCAAWMARMIRACRWDAETRKRLNALTRLAGDVAPKKKGTK